MPARAAPTPAVRGLTVGQVRVRPKNIAGTGTPPRWWTLTARTSSTWLPVRVVVIVEHEHEHEHERERGTVLFDTGQALASVTDKNYYPRGMLDWVYRRQARVTVTPSDDLATQLAEIGHPVSSLSGAALSHLHQDHAGAVAPLAATPLLVCAAELALLDEKAPELHGVLPAHDIHGDGTVLLLPTPGHSPGSMRLLIRRRDAPPLLLVGDVTDDPRLLPRAIVPDVGHRRTPLDTARRTHPDARGGRHVSSSPPPHDLR